MRGIGRERGQKPNRNPKALMERRDDDQTLEDKQALALRGDEDEQDEGKLRTRGS